MNQNIFRAYDIRGIADTDLTNEVVENIGRAYGTMMRRKGHRQVSVGRDVRLTSPRIQEALIRGILSTGIDVVNVGEVPTPVLYYSITRLTTDGGVMVTGSHNPIEYNGLKINEGLLSLYGEQILELRDLILSDDFEKGKGRQTQENIVPDYKQMLHERIHLDRPYKIVIDAGNGTAGPIAPEVYESMGCDVIRLFCEPDGNFPNHLPDPTVSEFTEDIRRRVVEVGADLGLAFDGDADRVGVIDERGNAVFADQILALLARDVLKRHRGAEILFDVKCSQMLPEEIEKHGGRPLMWKTGHSLIKKKMKEIGSPLAGEMSGHIFFKDGYFGFDDGIFVSFRLIQFLSRQEKLLGELIDELPVYVSTPELRIACPEEHKFDVVQALTKSFRQEYDVIDIDGARVSFGDGWGLVRVSNTQPLLVMRFEAKTQTRLKEIFEIFKNKLSDFPMVDIEQMRI